jgi:hypothetical protein
MRGWWWLRKEKRLARMADVQGIYSRHNTARHGKFYLIKSIISLSSIRIHLPLFVHLRESSLRRSPPDLSRTIPTGTSAQNEKLPKIPQALQNGSS